MKKILTLLFCCTMLFGYANPTTFYGKVTDGDTNEELIGANVALSKDGVFVTGVSTDFDGNYSISVDPGTYDISVSYIGYPAQTINGAIARAGQANKLDIQLSAGGTIDLEEIVVIDYKVPLISHDNTSQGTVITGQDIKNIKSLSGSTAGRKQKGNKISTIRLKKKNKKSSQNSRSNQRAQNSNRQANNNTALPVAGQLTAGEWKDLDNWTFWANLMKDKQFSRYREHWGFHPDDRFELKLSDKEGRALANIKVNLLNDVQEIVWSAMSDNKGSACLWGNFYGGDDSQFEFQIIYPEGEKQVPAIPYTEGLNSVQLATTCTSTKKIDVAFVVDVTGSMKDEINYLKAEVNDVISRAESEEDDLQIRTAAVYYGGRNEPQFLNSSPLTENKEETINFIKTSPIGGGGHEAVNVGLGMAVRDMDWNADAMARIVFILLDEPPAYEEAITEDMHQIIQEAAEKGIKIIPIAASGTNKPTEFLLKFFAMGTNSTYTFLTNHSGIGNNHIAPEAGSYNVETLNDLMVRLITESSEYHNCEEQIVPMEKIVSKKKLARKTKRNKANKLFSKQITCAPNPATDHVIITLEKAVGFLVITSSSGQIIAQYPQVEAGQIRLQTSDWTPGMYFLHFYEEGRHAIKKLVVGNVD